MDRKQVQEERTRGYFLSAAMDLIRAEGIAVVTARNVADRAGYSYATLYHYFRDIRDLIFSCVESFVEECRDFVRQDVEPAPAGRERLRAASRSYARFFVQYPGIFELLFLQKPGGMATGRSNLDSLSGFFDTLTESDWKVLQEENGNAPTLSSRTREAHKLALHGLLTLYLNRRKTLTYEQLLEEIDAVTDCLVCP